MIDDEKLWSYIRDELPAVELRAIEDLLRTDEACRVRLGELLDGAWGAQPTPGSVWRESRLSCPTREEWGGYLLGVLDSELAAYYQFHLDQVECPYCRANVADLQELSVSSEGPNRERQSRLFRSSMGAMNLSRPHDGVAEN